MKEIEQDNFRADAVIQEKTLIATSLGFDPKSPETWDHGLVGYILTIQRIDPDAVMKLRAKYFLSIGKREGWAR